MKVLITWGSKMGGTEGIADMLAAALEQEGVKVEMLQPREVKRADAYDGVIVGGGLYANRWHGDARRFVTRHARALRRVPVWFFSSGPLDDSAEHAAIAPTREVAVLMERVGAQGHVTFGGRLAPDAKGFPARALAKASSGDWRRPEIVKAWGREIARALPTARPGPAHEPAARSLHRLVGYAAAGGAACVAAGELSSRVASGGAATTLEALAATILALLVARRYFGARGAREPLRTAVCFAATTLALEVASLGGRWLPVILVFLVTWATGGLMATMPWPKPSARHHTASAA